MTSQYDGGQPFELDRSECLAYLRSAPVGRVVLVPAAPGPAEVMPVNFVLDGEHIVLRTGEGAILRAAVGGAYVTFQADSFDPDAGGHGWSVTAAGRAERASGPVLHRLGDLALVPLAGGSREHFVRIRVETIEGRRVGAPVGPARAGVAASEPAAAPAGR